MDQKEWRRREKKKMNEIGVKPVPLSGAGWLQKEDGESESLIVQLKSTEKNSIIVKLQDVLILFKNAIIVRKTPIFVIDFVNGPTLLCIRKEDILKVAEAFRKDEEVSMSKQVITSEIKELKDLF